MNKTPIPFTRDVSGGSDVSVTEIPYIRYVSDEELYFEQLNRQSLEKFILFWHLRSYKHLRSYNEYQYHMFYRYMWNIPPPPNYIPIIKSR